MVLPSRRSRAAATTVRTGTLDLGREILEGVRVGITHHLGWAVAVTPSADHEVVDRRRIELIEPGTPTAPIEHETKALDGDASARMVAEVRASALRAKSASLDQLAASLPEPIVSISLRAWPPTSPTTSSSNAAHRMSPWPTRSCTARCLSECAHVRGWAGSPLRREGRRGAGGQNPRCASRRCAPRTAGNAGTALDQGPPDRAHPPRSLPGDALPGRSARGATCGGSGWL